MFLFIAVSLVQLPLLFLSEPRWSQIGYHFVVPGIQGGASSAAVLLIIAIVGTTVAPWQLFFQQSNVIDKRITPRFIKYERGDTTLGAFVVVVGAAVILIAGVYAVRDTEPGRALHRRARRRQRAQGQERPARRAVRDLPAGRQHHRRRGRDPVHQLRVRRRVRAEALAAPQLARRQAVLRHLRRDDRGVGGHRAHSRHAAGTADHRGAGAGRGAAAVRERLPAAAVQRSRGPRPVAELTLAEHSWPA